MTRLREGEAKFDQLQGRLREALAEVEPLRSLVGPLREENARLQARLDQAAELINKLTARLEHYEHDGELAAAVFNLGRSLWRARGGKADGDS
ncbi:MAG: hypothetical protein R3B09_00305 [Nannocystaceae bacterium]